MLVVVDRGAKDGKVLRTESLCHNSLLHAPYLSIMESASLMISTTASADLYGVTFSAILLSTTKLSKSSAALA